MKDNKKIIQDIWNNICSYDYNIPTYYELYTFEFGDIKWIIRTKNIKLGFINYIYNSKKYNIINKSKILGEILLIAEEQNIKIILSYNNVNILTGEQIKKKGIHICFFNYDNSGFSNSRYNEYYLKKQNIDYIKKWLTNDIYYFQYEKDGTVLDPHSIKNIPYNYYTINDNIYCSCIYKHKLEIKDLLNITPFRIKNQNVDNQIDEFGLRLKQIMISINKTL